MEDTLKMTKMDRKQISKKLITGFIRMVNKYNAMEKFPVDYGTGASFYHSERHMLDVFAEHPELNITDLAKRVGVTKGAISQVVSKLEKKGAVERYKDSRDDKQVLVRLTKLGQTITNHHQQVNEKTINQLCTVIEENPQEEVDFICELFDWIEDHLDEGLKQMQSRHGK